MATRRIRPEDSNPPASTTTTVPGNEPVPGTGGALSEDQLKALLAQQTASTTGLPSDYQLPKRTYTLGGVTRTYSGNQLINLSTGEMRPMYNINTDPSGVIGQELQKNGPKGLSTFLKQLKNLGFYGSSYVGNGTSAQDINAVQQFLLYSNITGLDRQSALISAATNLPTGFSSGSGGSYQLTSPEDLRAVFQATAQQVIGRGLSEDDITKLVNSYQGLERSAGYAASGRGGYTAPPSAQTYATDQLRQKFKGEAQDFRAMDIADSILGILKGA